MLIIVIIIGSTLPEADRERSLTGVVVPPVVVVGVDERELAPLRVGGVANFWRLLTSNDFDLVHVVLLARFSNS